MIFVLFLDCSEVDASRLEDDVSRFASTSPSVPIPTTPCRFGNDGDDNDNARQTKR